MLSQGKRNQLEQGIQTDGPETPRMHVHKVIYTRKHNLLLP